LLSNTQHARQQDDDACQRPTNLFFSVYQLLSDSPILGLLHLTRGRTCELLF
jgi:hypothetical protein